MHVSQASECAYVHTKLAVSNKTQMLPMELTVAFRAWIARLLWKPMEMMMETISSGGWLSNSTAPKPATPLEAAPPNTGTTNGSAKSGRSKHSSDLSFVIHELESQQYTQTNRTLKAAQKSAYSSFHLPSWVRDVWKDLKTSWTCKSQNI